jgi:peptide/nickel transport system substrate-binding protein
VIPFEAVLKFGKDFRSNPIGTGPFYIKLWREGEKLILRKNPKYFEKDEEGNELPYLEAINITFIADKQSEFLEFIKGNIDFISGLHPASKDELLTRTGELNPKYHSKIKMLTGPYLNTEYLGILVDTSLKLVKESPLRNPLVRKAFGYGIDRAKMMIHLRSNMGYPAVQGFVPVGMPNYSGIKKGFNHNPDLARDLLKDAGYPEGEGISPITISTTDDYVDICEFIQHQLNELGFIINVEVFPGAAYREMVANSKLLVFRGSWVADYADPENYLALFYSGNFSPAGPNYTHFKSDKYDKLYLQSALVKDKVARNHIYNLMDSTILSDAVVVPLYYDKVIRFVSIDIHGMDTNPMNLLDLKKVYKK